MKDKYTELKNQILQDYEELKEHNKTDYIRGMLQQNLKLQMLINDLDQLED